MIPVNKNLIKEIDEVFDSKNNVILFGEKGSGTTTTSVYYASKNFDTYFFFESESSEKLEIELNHSINNLYHKDRISVYENIESLAKSSRILIILDQVENFEDVEDFINKFSKKVNFLITTHKTLTPRQNFVQLDQPQINSSNARKYLINETDRFFHPKEIETLVEFLKKKKNLSHFFLSKIANIINFYSSIYTSEDLIIKICDSIKSPLEIIFDSIRDKKTFEIFFTMFFFDHKFINLNLFYSFFESKTNYVIKTNLKKLKKMSLISDKEKYEQNGIVVHDLVYDAALKYIYKDDHLIKNFGNLYESVLNFYFDNFGSKLQEGINFYCHVKKILSAEFNFLNSYFNDLKLKRVNRLRSYLYYNLALFRFNHLIDYNECLRLCYIGKSNSELESQFDELIRKCQEFNFNLQLNEKVGLDKKLEEQQSNSIKGSESISKIQLPVFMQTEETNEWLREKMISKAIIHYLTPINGSKLMDYFVFLTNNKIFFDLVLKQEIPNATNEEIDHFGKCIEKLFIDPLQNTI